MRKQRRSGRYQEIVLEGDSTVVAPAPAALVAAVAAAERAGEPRPSGSFAPSADLEGIDRFTAAVLAEPDSRAVARAPMAQPVAWLTPEIRAAIARAVTPIAPGVGALADELRWRFELALTFIQTLDARAQVGAAVNLADVQAVAVLYHCTIY